ncbi:unnamed protein product [Mytilus edulis]|uniref:Uncharacterized protein n=1 Tax=Mytilus edulis TaxID=6550 RepID=A0A8S3QQS5_MYTED|nr:unnamed protein product [Mytilus edulis]
MYLQCILEGDSLNCLNLNCSISDSIMQILDIKSFGSIVTDISTTSAVLITEIDKQAQILLHTSMANKSIEDIQVNKIRQFKVPSKSGITGTTLCPNGDIIFVDYGDGQRLLIMDNMGNFRREILISPIQPYGVTSLVDRSVAVSSWKNEDIHVVDIDSGTITAHIRGDFCGDLTRIQNTLLCGTQSNEVKAIDLRDNSISSLVSDIAIDSETYLATSSDNIFVTNSSNNTVTCCKMNGERVWQYTDQSIVEIPLGVTVDKYKNVYVASYGKGSVVLITSDGKKARTILKNDGPYSVNFDQNQNNLLVTCCNGDAFLYNISYD